MSLSNDAQITALSDVSSEDFKDAWKDFADASIAALCNKDFQSHTDETEYKDIKFYRTKRLFLNNAPILSVASVIDNAQSSSTITLNANSFMLLEGQGIIELKEPEELTDGDPQYFTVGTKSVKVIYTYGYAAVPADIELFASYLVARNAIIWKRSSDAGISASDMSISGVKSLKLADFGVTFVDSEKTHIDKDIENFKKTIVKKYKIDSPMRVV